MRIRRRPQGQSLLSSLQHSDPSTAPPQPPPPPNAARNQQHWPLLSGRAEEGEEEDKKRLEEFRLHPNADLGGAADDGSSAARRAALPLLPTQAGNGNGNGNVVGRLSESPGNGGAQPRRQGAVAAAPPDGLHSHRSGLENGHYRGRPEPVPTSAAGERLLNGGGMPVPAVTSSLNVKEESKNGSGGTKKRRGPAVLMEGSRCSRVNGRGWRCSQPTLVGYSLCEHHLGKGRMRSGAGRASPGAGAAQLGRTEPGRKNAAAVPRADEPPSVGHL